MKPKKIPPPKYKKGHKILFYASIESAELIEKAFKELIKSQNPKYKTNGKD